MEVLDASYFSMGGHGAYVWPAYGFAALVLGGLAAASLRALKAAQRRLAQLAPGERHEA